MAASDEDGRLTPSVLDRLIDHEPDRNADAAKSNTQTLDEIQQAVRRDLQNLLNTRIRCAELPKDLTELPDSIVNYGVPDITSSHLRSARRQRDFLKSLESIIRAFEPRFRSVRVTPLENADYLDMTVRFRIHAELQAVSGARAFQFDSSLDPSGKFTLRGESS